MSKEVYLSNLEWTKTHDNIGGVIGNVVFKDNISYEEYEKLLDTVYYTLTKKDDIERLNKRIKELEEGFKTTIEDLCETTEELEKSNNIINELDKQNGELGADLSIIKDRVIKTNWWLENMLKQATNRETKAIINGALDLLLGSDKE